MTYPDLRSELDRMFPGWRTWDQPEPKREQPEEKPTLDDKFHEFIQQEEEGGEK